MSKRDSVILLVFICIELKYNKINVCDSDERDKHGNNSQKIFWRTTEK